MKELYLRHVAALLVATSVVSAAPMDGVSVLKELADAGYVVSNTPPEHNIGQRIATMLFEIYRNNVYYQLAHKGTQRLEYNTKMSEAAYQILEFCLGLSQARTTMILQTNNFSYKPEHDKGFMAHHGKQLYQVDFVRSYKDCLQSAALNRFDAVAKPVSQSLCELYDIFLKVLPETQKDNINELFKQFANVLDL